MPTTDLIIVGGGIVGLATAYRYQLRFPASCIGNPDRVRFTAYAQLYDDAGAGIIGGDCAPAWAELSDWLSIR